LDHPDSKEALDSQEAQVLLEQVGHQARLVRQALLDLKVKLAMLVNLEHKDLLEALVQLVHLDLRVQADHQDLKVLLDQRVHQAIQELLEL
jgi:hypothetical protein